MSHNIFITGGAGFIGSRLVFALLENEPNSRIWVFDNLHPQVHGEHARPPLFPDEVTFIEGDIVDKSFLKGVVAQVRPELIFHLAAETGTGQSHGEVSRYCDVNVVGTANLIESIREQGGDFTKKIVLSASRAIYGEGAYRDMYGKVFTGLPRITERMAKGDFSVPLPDEAQHPVSPHPSIASLSPAPASVYASTKLMQELLLKQSGEGSAWNTTILRFQNVYGPGQSLLNPYTGVLSIFAKQLLEGKVLDIYEDGLIARDFVYVDDVVNSLVKAGQADLVHGATMDIGSGKAVTILEVARLLMKFLECSDESYKITGQFRAGDIRHACADISAAAQNLGWCPQVDLETGIAHLSNWARTEFK